MRLRIPLAMAMAAAAVLSGAFPARAALFSKAYAFKANTTLQVGTEIQAGLRLDSIEFIVAPDDGSPSGLFNGPRVKVAISNVGDQSVRVGIAVAVTDDESRLLGAASGGTKMFPLRVDRQMIYTLDFAGVNAEIAKGTVFRITIEPRP